MKPGTSISQQARARIVLRGAPHGVLHAVLQAVLRAALRRVMTGALMTVCALSTPASALRAQIKVNPTGVSTNSMGATTVFLTFGGLANQVPVEGIWCGEVKPAVLPERGTKCDPNTIYGRLPLRSNLARVGSNAALTDIMSIPASVARRAYLAAFRGQSATFFYVRRFASTTGGADEFVVVTCRLTGGGASVPFSLTNVTVAFESKAPVQFVTAGELPPPLAASIVYNGVGQLRGRWEVVMPGEELPSPNDLLTEATLPPEERGTQRRYAQLERFSIPLMPNGKYLLAGPDPARLPHDVEGIYYVLLRIESTDDGAGDSNLGAVGAGNGVLHNGAVAGFPMPMLRYVVGGATSALEHASADRTLLPLSPSANARWFADSLLTARWTSMPGAAYYRVEFETAAGATLLSAIVRKGKSEYDVPPVVAEKAAADEVRWRVVALDGLGTTLRRSAWRRFRFVPRPPAGS